MDLEFQDKVSLANELIQSEKFEEAIETASIALLSAVSLGDVSKARIVLIQAHFNLNHFDEVCSLVDELNSPIPGSDEYLANMIGLSCLGAPTRYDRYRTLKVLTNSAESVCRLCFDSDADFASLRSVAMDIADSRYGEALERFSELQVPGAKRNLIQENLTKNLLVEYISSFSKVSIVQIAHEFRFTKDNAASYIEHLIARYPRVSEYRIDARMGEIHRNHRMAEQRLCRINLERERLSAEITNELSLFNLRLLTSTGRWIVGKDVPT